MRACVRTRVSIVAVCAALLFFAACGGGGGGGGGTAAIAVNGMVVDSSNAAVSGANIILNHDASSLVTTGADGMFSFASVTTPYTLTMKSGTAIAEYRNLSRADPKLGTSTGGAIYSASLSGTVTGPAFPLALDQGILIGANNGVFVSGAANATTGAYSGTFIWSGGSAKTADLAALQLSYTSPLITGYLQTGTRTGVGLNNGVGQTNLDIALTTPVTTASTILNYSLGAYTNSSGGKYLLLNANGAQFLFIGGATIPSGSTVLLPSDGATFMIQGMDAAGNRITKIGTAVLSGTTTLDLPASTVLKNSLPADGATNVSKTPTLSWTPVSGADIYLVTLSGGGNGYSFYLPSSISTLTIPDYTTLGLPLAGATTYNWTVIAFKSSGLSLDSVTDPVMSGVSTINLYMSAGLELYTSGSTNFTTIP